jgi:hypothetical protein
VSRERPPLLKGQGVRFASVGVGLVIGLGIMLTVFTVGSEAPRS